MKLKWSRRALLISTAHEPITFVGYRRMYSLMRRGVVDVLSEWEGEKIVHDVNVPAILKLKNFILARSAHKICLYNRDVVLARDEYQCQYCCKRLVLREATIDHIMPRSRGGKNHWTNCVASCKSCNRLKNNFTPEEAGMLLVRRPGLPSITHFWVANVQRVPTEAEWHPDWDHYLAT
jgi:hypothetical protein